jgi:hypothetical protein
LEVAITAIICLGIWWLIKKTRAHRQRNRETAPYDASAPYIPREGLISILTLGQLRQIFGGSDEPTDAEWRQAGVATYRVMAEGHFGDANADTSMWSLLKQPDRRAAMINELVGHFGAHPDVGADIGHALFSTDPKVYWPILADLMSVKPGEVAPTDKPPADTMGVSLWAAFDPHLRNTMCETAAEQFKLNPEVGIHMMRALFSTDRRHADSIIAKMVRAENEKGLTPITTKAVSAYDFSHEEINKTFTPEELREIFGHDNPAIADWERLGVECGPGFARRLMLYDKLYWDWVIGLRQEKQKGVTRITSKPAGAYYFTHEEINKTFTPEELREIFGHDNPAIADWERLGVECGPGFARRLMLYDKLYWDWVIGLRREKRAEPSYLVQDLESPRRQKEMAYLAAQASKSDVAAQ